MQLTRHRHTVKPAEAGQKTLASQAFHPGTAANHVRPRLTSVFCDNYQLPFMNPRVSTLCYYITYLTTSFSSATSVRNYVCGVRLLHKQLGVAVEALDCFPVQCLRRLADLTMQTPPLRRLRILPHLQSFFLLGLPGTCYEGVPHLRFPGDAQAEQPGSRCIICF